MLSNLDPYDGQYSSDTEENLDRNSDYIFRLLALEGDVVTEPDPSTNIPVKGSPTGGK